ncbi:MAG: hypothetical protein Q9N68_11375, partial [Gammaproteobacteria bacterium]|nr:hypothetical protein [Gammaproteobacteria bacterium]
PDVSSHRWGASEAFTRTASPACLDVGNGLVAVLYLIRNLRGIKSYDAIYSDRYFTVVGIFINRCVRLIKG